MNAPSTFSRWILTWRAPAHFMCAGGFAGSGGSSALQAEPPSKKKTPPNFRRTGVIALFCAVLAFAAAFISPIRAAPVYELITEFQRVPSTPSWGSLLLHSDGNFYGASNSGGAQDRGTIYKVTPAGVSSVVVNFNGTGGAVNGRFPNCRLVGAGGMIWGSTTKGGASDRGTLFKFDPVTGETVTLTEFIGNGPGPRGDSPRGGLASDGAGNLWGVTSAGGSTDRGTIFKINMATGVMTPMIDFTGVSGTKGMNPLAGLVSDGAGNFWGTTQLGGAFSSGTVFKVNIASGVLTTVVEFPSSGSTPRSPYSALVNDGAGSFWGTTYQGGAGNFGTIYKVNMTTGALTTVVQFTGTTGAAPGNHPYAELASDSLGNFWGTTYQGGAPDSGTIFKVNMTTGAFTSILEFNSVSAPAVEHPTAGLTADGAGNFWGTTQASFSSPGGTVFKINIGNGAYTSVMSNRNGLSSGLGTNPNNPLVADNAGSLWGTTYLPPGAAGGGTVYKVDPTSGVATRVVLLNSTIDKQPAGGLVDDGAGFFWGVTSQAGPFFNGSIFKVNATTGAVTAMAAFTGSSGATKGSKPLTGLTKDGLGFLWGVTSDGGSPNNGTIFKINITTGTFTTMAEFTDQTGPVFGNDPTGQLIKDAAGNLWGTTRQGGTTNAGTLFKINATSGAFTNVITFTGTTGAAKGSLPWSGLTSDGAGNLWGTTTGGGSGNFGTIFKVNATTGVLTTVVEFTGTSGAVRGSVPRSALTLDGAGNFWSMTNEGGASGLGTIFRVTPAGAFTSVFDLTGYGGAVRGQKPVFGGMFKYTDGHLYGTLPEGGLGGGGLVFRIRFGPAPVTLVATNVGFTGATLNGTLNPNGTVTAASFEYGTDPTLATFQTIAAGNTTAGGAPEAVLAAPTGLAEDTTYYYRVVGLNAENTTSQRGEILSFRTLSVPIPSAAVPITFDLGGVPGSATTGSAAPDAMGNGDNTKFDTLRRGGYLADNGNMAFTGNLEIGTGGVTMNPNNFQGVWKGVGSLVTRLARSGDAAPESGNALFNVLPEVPHINDLGDITILASLVHGAGTPITTDDNDTGLWSELGGTGFQILIREGDQIPGLPTGTLLGRFEDGCFATATISSSEGEAAFTVTFKGGSTDSALLRCSVVDTITTAVGVVARENAPAGATGETFGFLNSDFTDAARMDAQGGIVFGALLKPSGKTSLWYQPRGGALVKALVAGEAAPGTTATFQSLDVPSMGDGGTFAFRGVLNLDGDNTANDKNDGIWRGDTAGGFNCILRRGDTNTNRPGLFSGAILTANPNMKAGNIYSGWLANSNNGAWLGWVDLAGDGISSYPADTIGIYTDIGLGTMNLLIASGDAAPGIAGATMFFLDHPVAGGGAQSDFLAFIGTVTGGGTTAGMDDKGIWRSYGGAPPALVIRTGQTITTTQGTKTIADVDWPGSNLADHLWETPVMDGTGRLIVLVTFTDGTTSQVLVPSVL